MTEGRTSTSWNRKSNPEGEQKTPGRLLAIIKSGELTHEWDLPYQGELVPVVYDLFPTGTRMDIHERTSGLDPQAKAALTDFFNVLHVLRSIDGYDFKGGDVDDKIAYLRQFPEPLMALFVEHYTTARLKQIKKSEDLFDQLGKTSPDRR